MPETRITLPARYQRQAIDRIDRVVRDLMREPEWALDPDETGTVEIVIRRVPGVAVSGVTIRHESGHAA